MINASFRKEWLKPYQALSESEKREIANHALSRFISARDYWTPIWARGRTCLEFFEGKVFTADELARLEEEEKLVVQASSAKPAIDAIYGTLMETLKDGVVAGNGGEDASAQHIVTTLMKKFERDNLLRMKAYETCRNTGITSVPNWLWIEPRDPRDPDEEGISIESCEWDSIVPDPRWQDRQLKDLEYAFRIRQMSAADIEAAYQVSVERDLLLTQALAVDGLSTGTYAERHRVMEEIRNGGVSFSNTGLLSIFEMTHWVRMPIRAYVDSMGHSEIIPLHWDEARIAQWQEINPDSRIVTKMERVLWVTTVSSTGALLDNGAHWLQAGIFPGVPDLPDRVNGKWLGLLEPVLDLMKQEAYSFTEWGHSIRTLANNLWMVRKGAIKDSEEFRKQITAPNGVIEYEAGFTPDDVKRLDNTREQRAFAELAQAASTKMAELLVEKNFQGGVQSSQESDKVVQTRIKQTVSKLAMPVYGMHEFWLNVHRLIVKAIPYAIQNERVFRIFDETNGQAAYQDLAVNVPVEWDVNGEVVRMMNNLSGADWDYFETESDNSISGNEHERNLMKEFMEANANSPPEVLEALALSYPSVKVQAFGKQLKQLREQREQAPPPPPEVKYSMSFSGKDLGIKASQEAAVNAGILKPEQIEGAGLPEEGDPATIGSAEPTPAQEEMPV